MDEVSDSEKKLVEVAHEGERALNTVTLHRVEKANALDAGLVRAIAAVIGRIEAAAARNGRAATMVLRSAHAAFSAGFDLAEVETQSEGDILLRFVELERLFQGLRRGPTPSIAVVEGAAFGAGADLAIACTWRVGTPKARFRFPGFRFGVALGTRHLANVVGTQTARSILLENRLLDAEEALALGLLSHLVDPEAISDTVSALAATTNELPAGAPGRIIALTAPATEDADLADLVRSLTDGGLHAKIAGYLASRDAAAKAGIRS